ncbi:D-isomer specific 2-hydroxyacid dehydrogenase family protein [Kitasatospora sp. MBT66]|uniref:NAD(P)-dependent oxidoreductase n=1 Tax=Kitasatospora sp. MBT66 TaxID=1444769 RepID=UPI001E501D12|nr:NAD(P)-dependent oxidoreductase [Kitasatospora sp. MBT66]
MLGRYRILLLDAAPGDLLGVELERLLGHGLAVTLNLRRVADRAGARATWGGRVGFTDFDPFDEAALIAETLRDGGHQAVKSRAGVPLRAAFLAATAGGADASGAAGACGAAGVSGAAAVSGAAGTATGALRVIGRAGAGTDHVDLAAATRLGVAVTHTPGSNADAVAEFALAQLLALTRDLAGHNTASHRGDWRSPAAPARALSELTLGILGPGRIGRALAGRARALGMAVQGLGRTPAEGDGVRRADSLAELLATSDVVSVHLPLTARTRGLVGRRELALLRPGAILLNTARGGIVDERALADALRDPGHPLAAAAVDTFEHEHAAFDSPLFGLPNALLTPHVAGMTRSAMAEAAVRCADHIAALLYGRPDGVPVANG